MSDENLILSKDVPRNIIFIVILWLPSYLFILKHMFYKNNSLLTKYKLFKEENDIQIKKQKQERVDSLYSPKKIEESPAFVVREQLGKYPVNEKTGYVYYVIFLLAGKLLKFVYQLVFYPTFFVIEKIGFESDSTKLEIMCPIKDNHTIAVAENSTSSEVKCLSCFQEHKNPEIVKNLSMFYLDGFILLLCIFIMIQLVFFLPQTMLLLISAMMVLFFGIYYNIMIPINQKVSKETK
jgi:hypothetical protein